jgi:hypothetical protein
MPFEEFLVTNTVAVPTVAFLQNALGAVLLSFALAWMYVRFGTSLSNRRAFARNFVLLALTTTLIITVVKSSLALSLGLVGALSIVRFRAAIKEPEELAYLFITIAIGLGMGAGQRQVTILGLVIIFAVIALRYLTRPTEQNENLLLTVSIPAPSTLGLSQVVDILRESCSSILLKRFDVSDELLEARFLVDFASFTQLDAALESLREQGESVRVTFLEQRDI